MAGFEATRKQRLIATIIMSFSFLVVELVVGFYTHSLALIADAFHYLSDLIGIVVALVALMVSERTEPAPQGYTFGLQRANLLGAFFNGVFLLALGVSILVQALERFIEMKRKTDMENPLLVLIVGGIGLALNVLVMSFLHEHDHSHDHGHGHGHEAEHSQGSGQPGDSVETPHRDAASDYEARPTPVSPCLTYLVIYHLAYTNHHEHTHTTTRVVSPGRDLGMLGVFVHILGDAINNIGVIVAAVIIWKAEGQGRFYADPAVGVFIAVMILLSALPLVKNSGVILLQIAPGGINLDDIKHDIEMIPGVESVHELHIWRLDQHKSIASVHIVVDGRTVKSFADKAKIVMECLHAYGIHSATLQPEVSATGPMILSEDPLGMHPTSIELGTGVRNRRRRGGQSHCQLICGSMCDGMRCCAHVQM
ncbi:cation efflux protein [Dactylonectria estremocensis]|uniref:Cation efflux protein n=1 Tax=Dactylonectria estremocensis TaxID=1079267 RepID=A0A9P9F1I9_9HYPO|nr:cation efflux protein [Dactylonectria estremocensis]